MIKAGFVSGPQVNWAQRFVYWLDSRTGIFDKIQKKRANWFMQKFQVRSWLGGRCRTLDVGCGTGAITNQLAEGGESSVVGIDVINFLTLGQSASRKFHYVQADATMIPFGNSSFDSVTVFWVLHHTRNPIEIIKEAKRVLSKHGRLIIVEDIGSGTWLTRTLVRLYDSVVNLELRHAMEINMSMTEWRDILAADGDLAIVESQLVPSIVLLPFLKFGILIAEKV